MCTKLSQRDVFLQDHWDAILKLAKKNQLLAEKVSKLPKMIKKACKTALPQGGMADANKNMFGPERIVIIRQSSVESSSSSSKSSSGSKSSKEGKSRSSEDSKAWDEKSADFVDNG